MYCPRRMGILNFKCNNVSQYITEADVNIQFSDFLVNEKPNGFTTTEKRSPSIEATFQMPDEMCLTDLQKECGKTIVAEEYNGRTWVLERAHPSGDMTWNATQGEITVKWIGSKIREINPNKQEATALA